MILENNLKTTRENKGLTQEKIAHQVKRSKIAYQRYEAGKRAPDVYTAQEIAQVLDTTVEELFPLQQRQLRREPDNRAV